MPVAAQGQPADIYIINTCVVTAATEAQSRQLIRRAAKTNPDAEIIVTGCYVHSDPQRLCGISRNVRLLGNADKKEIIAFVRKRQTAETSPHRVTDIRQTVAFDTPAANRLFDRTRVFLKIQDGCNSRCSYCIVPSVRGRSRSLAPGDVLERATALCENGYREIVLTGVHIGAYGLDFSPNFSLLNLLKQLAAAGGLKNTRIRLSSIEPNELTDVLIDFIAGSDRFCPHFHIPLQSGDSHILKQMNRPYSSGFFRDRVERIQATVPDVNIGIDVMAGFPGETEKQFQNTVELVERLSPGYLHVFPYSVRAGTPASRLQGQIPEKVKKTRAAVLRDISDRKRKAFYAGFINKTLNVIAEGRGGASEGGLRGISQNYIPVYFKGTASMIGAQVLVKVVGVDGFTVTGQTE